MAKRPATKKSTVDSDFESEGDSVLHAKPARRTTGKSRVTESDSDELQVSLDGLVLTIALSMTSLRHRAKLLHALVEASQPRRRHTLKCLTRKSYDNGLDVQYCNIRGRRV